VVRWLGALAVAAALVAAVAARWWTYLDLTVYRYGGHLVLEHHQLYAGGEPHSGLLFTYPPVAALAFTLLTLVPAYAAAGVWSAASVLALAATVAAFARAQGRLVTGQWLALATVAALLLDPVRETLMFGQVNLFLMAMVSLDLLVLRGRWTGVLIGIAAGIKLTPAIFVVLLLLVGRRAAAVRAVAAFGATVLVGLVAIPGDATTYWTSSVWASSRVGHLEFIRNQSLLGTLTRLLHHEPSDALWLGVAVPVGVALLLLARAWWRRGAPDVAVLLTAAAMLMCSPISWDHHAVWAAPLLLVLWQRAPRWLLVPVVALLLVGLRPLVLHGEMRELTWDPWQQVVGNAYTWAVLALGVVAAVALRQARPSSRSVSSGSAADVAAYDVNQRRAPDNPVDPVISG
jgi:alpha-1,2-mannosyltransferase